MSAKTDQQGGVRVEIPHVYEGDRHQEFEDTPEARLELSEKINKLKRDGAACFLKQGKGKYQKIRSYDPETNEWIVEGTVQRLPAEGTIVEVVPMVAGG